MLMVVVSCLDILASHFRLASAFPGIPHLSLYRVQRNALSNGYKTFSVINIFIQSDASTPSFCLHTNSLTKCSTVKVGMTKEPLEGDDASKQVIPTWTYKPYEPSRRPSIKENRASNRRYYSSKSENWIVPNKITIPESKLEISFTRSSGAGGQNVNKVNTQVVVRFHVMDAEWMPKEVRERVCQNEGNRINKEGYISISCQEHRTQIQNRKTAMDKIQEIVLQNYPRPKKRKIRKGITKKAKEINKEQKRIQSQVKKNRGRVDF